MKIAVVGTGIAGNVAARLLHRDHDLTIFEANPYIGGHTHTHDVVENDRFLRIDTGFIVYNTQTYPNFIKLIDRLGVETQPTTMSFSVHDLRNDFEFGGHSYRALFADRRNAFRPWFYRMLREISRFNRLAQKLIETDGEELALDQFLERHQFSRKFIEYYIIPLGSAVWSTDPSRMLKFPARYLAQFFYNHQMLSTKTHRHWRVIKNGSQSYVAKLTDDFRDRIRLNTAVTKIVREVDGVEVYTKGARQKFDHVIFACHSDQALAILDDPTEKERQILGAFQYRPNETILHTDTALLPKNKHAWSSWNYHVSDENSTEPRVTYNMNILQGLTAEKTYLVSLNCLDLIDPQKIITSISYDHPLYTPETVAAQKRFDEISGHAYRTHYCGAYWNYGFHEDGVTSALRVARAFGARL